eukprot:13486748-Alexandrium_andersonii.AAC.1
MIVQLAKKFYDALPTNGEEGPAVQDMKAIASCNPALAKLPTVWPTLEALEDACMLRIRYMCIALAE